MPKEDVPKSSDRKRLFFNIYPEHASPQTIVRLLCEHAACH
jgi:hypothetical protein